MKNQNNKLGMDFVDSIELKCLLISRGLKVDKAVYKLLSEKYRISPNALCCNCLILPDNTIVMLTDLTFHMSTVSSMFSWDNLKLIKHLNDMTTEFRITMVEDTPYLFYMDEEVTPVSFPPYSRFYKQKTSRGMSFKGNSVLQGLDWIAFQCLWPCEYAQAGEPCEFCFSGGQFEALKRRNKSMPSVPSVCDFIEIIQYAVENDGVNSVQITGGSTFHSEVEKRQISGYMDGIDNQLGRGKLKGEILLYVTPPDSRQILDDYFSVP